MDVISPCINQCRLDRKTKTCEGCGRTLEQIAEAGRKNKQSFNSLPLGTKGEGIPLSVVYKDT